MQLDTLFAYTGGKAFDASRPCIVFIHGAQHDHTVWALQSRSLAHHGYAVLAVDLPGHGRSGGEAPASIEAMAQQLARALAPLASPSFILVGHSMGSLIALELAPLLAPRVAGVVLVGTAFPMRVSDTLLAATREDPPGALQMINVWSHSASIAPFAVRPGSPGPGFNVVWQNLRLMERVASRNGPTPLINGFAACNQYAHGLQAAQALPCPALFVLGAVDQMTPPKAAQSLVGAVKDATVVNLPATGHNAMGENPDGVRRAIEQFAARLMATA